MIFLYVICAHVSQTFNKTESHRKNECMKAILFLVSFKDAPGYASLEAQTSRASNNGGCKCVTCVWANPEPVQQEINSK